MFFYKVSEDLSLECHKGEGFFLEKHGERIFIDHSEVYRLQQSIEKYKVRCNKKNHRAKYDLLLTIKRYPRTKESYVRILHVDIHTINNWVRIGLLEKNSKGKYLANISKIKEQLATS